LVKQFWLFHKYKSLLPNLIFLDNNQKLFIINDVKIEAILDIIEAILDIKVLSSVKMSDAIDNRKILAILSTVFVLINSSASSPTQLNDRRVVNILRLCLRSKATRLTGVEADRLRA
jgi:hypothetical protein